LDGLVYPAISVKTWPPEFPDALDQIGNLHAIRTIPEFRTFYTPPKIATLTDRAGLTVDGNFHLLTDLPCLQTPHHATK